MSIDCDVVVVGAGPAGLFLASELRLAGVDCIVVERRAEPDLKDKAHGLLGQAVRLLDHRGLIERCGGPSVPTPAPAFFFAGLPLLLRDLGPSSPLYLLPVDQADLERILGERAVELGADVRRGWTVTAFDQDDTYVTVEVVDSDGTGHSVTARYLVGCDGARSAIRAHLNIDFPGSRDDRVVDRWAMISPNDDLRVLDDGRVHVGGLGEIQAAFHRTEQGVFTILGRNPAAPIVNTAEWQDQPAQNYPGPGDPMTLSEMEDSVERVLGVRITLSPPPSNAPGLLRRLCGRNTRLAEHYRDRRVFLAGDAAHTSHGPTLNLALQDAANLAWKLAASVHGWAPRDLLDTYHTERHAAGQREVMWTQAETALMAPGADVTALRTLVRELLDNRDTLATVATLMAGADTRYDMGDAHPAPQTGYFAPPLDLRTTTGQSLRLAELQRDARPLLLNPSDDADVAKAAQPWTNRVHLVTATTTRPETPAMLIRPDGYVAWSGTDATRLRSALTRWFGPEPS